MSSSKHIVLRRGALLSAALLATTAWPVLAQAQQPTMPVVGSLSGASPDAYADSMSGFQQGLSEAGFIEGRKVGNRAGLGVPGG